MSGVRIACTSFVVVLGLCVATASAEGFKFPDLNPFDGKKTDNRTRTSSSNNTSLFRSRPKMETPQLRRTSTGRSNRPTTWQKMQQDTGEFFSSMTSWTRPKPAKQTARQSKPKPKSNASPFAWLFPQPDKQPPIRSVNEYLSLPQPGIDD